MATQDELNTNDGMYTNNNFSPYYERNTNQNMDTGYNTGSSQSNNQTFVQRPNNQGGTNYNAPLPNARMMKKDDNGFAIASLVLGIIALVLSVFIGILPGILAIVFGAVSLAKKQSQKRCAIAGIITGGLGTLISILVIVAIFIIGVTYEDSYESSRDVYEDFEERNIDDDYSSDSSRSTIGDIYEKDSDSSKDDDNSDFSFSSEGMEGNIYTCSDGSEILFDDNGEFVWYKEEGIYDDNYRYGEYVLYYGEEAEEYLIDDLSDYGVTSTELEEYFDRNEGDELYNRENFCVLVLNNTGAYIDGEETDEEAYITPYMGFFYEGYYEAANMNSGNYAYFTEE